MSQIRCKICQSQASEKWKLTVLSKYLASYYQCTVCDYAFTEDPYWLQEAYSNSITNTDIGLIARSLWMSKIISNFLFLTGRSNGRFLDFAGGYGVLTRMMRDRGHSFYSSDKYTQNLFAKDFEFKNDFAPDAITAFEVAEHFENPTEFFDSILRLCPNGPIIFSTCLNDGQFDASWWYLSPETGQHISFFSKQSLKLLANKYAMKLASYKDLHILHRSGLGRYYDFAMKVSQKKVLSSILSAIVSKLRPSLLGRDFDYVRRLNGVVKEVGK